MKHTKNKSEKPKMWKQSIIWFNPTFIKFISTNVAKIFLQLVTKHFQEPTSFTKFVFTIQLNSWTTCQKSSRDIISHIKTMQTKCNCRKKAECLMERNCQVNDIIYNCDITRPFPKTCTLDLQRENGRAVSITTSYYLNTRDIQIRQHFQVTCGIWKVLQVKHLTYSCLFWEVH